MVGRNEFQGDKVRLRAIEPDEWESFLVFEGDTDLTRLSGSTHLPASRESTRLWAEEASKRKEDDQASLRVETLDGTLVGWVSVGRTDRRNGLFTYAVGIGREHWRRGYGTDAVLLLLRFYFAELAYRKVETKVYSFNEASLSFHDYLGFQREGAAAPLCSPWASTTTWTLKHEAWLRSRHFEDNALAESVIGLYKSELIFNRGPWRTVEDVELATLSWVHWWNTTRLHSAIGYLPPAEFEAVHYARSQPVNEAGVH